MKTFLDANNNLWALEINLETLELVLTQCQFDLMTLFSEKLESLARLYNDPKFLTEVLWVLCKPEIEKAEFRRAMRGDALEHGADAIVHDVIDFFPSARRQTLLNILAKVQEQATAKDTVISEQLSKIDVLTEVRKEVEKRLISSKSEASATSSLESSAG